MPRLSVASPIGRLTLFEEGTERCNPGSRADHDYRGRGVLRQAEVCIRMEEDRHRHANAGAVSEVPAGHSLAAAAMRVVPHHAHCGLHIVLVHGLARRDGVQARREARQQGDQLRGLARDVGVLLQNVQDVATP